MTGKDDLDLESAAAGAPRISSDPLLARFDTMNLLLARIVDALEGLDETVAAIYEGQAEGEDLDGLPNSGPDA